MSKLRLLGAIAAGLVLATFPFLRYAGGHVHRRPHMDHAPHHGGQLGMSGDHHVEIVHRADCVEIFVSDAQRRPLAVAGGRLTIDGVATVPLVVSGDKLIADAAGSARDVEVHAELADGSSVRIDFVLPD